MRKIILAVALLWAPLALTACKQTLTDVAQGNSVAGATVKDEKAIYAAEAAYNVAANAYVSADSRGLLTADMKAKVKPVMVKAYDSLKLARAAYKVGDAVGLANQVAAVQGFASEAQLLLPKPNN